MDIRQDNQVVRYSEIVKTIDLEPIKMVDGDDLRFRVEIVKDSFIGDYYLNLWRIENYRIQPTFPQKSGFLVKDLSDEEILVKDIVTLDGIRSNSPDDLLKLALREISVKFT